MVIKRIILVIISLAFGLVVTTGVTILIGTTPAEYGSMYFITTVLSLAAGLAIWLDRIMGTKILPS